MRLEGGYVDDVNDRGGETKFGISKRSYPDLNISKLTLKDAQEIYWRDYWLANRCPDFPEPLAVALFDGAVNHGVKASTKAMQRALGVLADGVIGPITLSRAQRSDCRNILINYLANRAQIYHTLMISDPSQSAFSAGWFRRLFKLQQYIFQEHWPWVL